MKEILTFDNSAERYLNIAKQKSEKGDLKGALVFAFNAFNKSPRSLEVLSFIANLYEELGYNDLSNEYWFLYIDVSPEEKRSLAYEALAKNYFYLEEIYPMGIYIDKLLTKLDVCEPIDKEMISKVFDVNELRKRDKYKIAYSSGEGYYKQIVNEGTSFLRRGKPDEAIEKFSLVPPTSKEYKEARESLAIALLLTGDALGALNALREAVKNGVNTLSIYCSLSNMAEEAGDKDKADFYYKKALSFTPDNEEDALRIGLASVEREDHENVIKIFSRLLREKSFNVEALHYLGLAYLNTGEYSSAARCFSDELIIIPDDLVTKHYLFLSEKLLNGEKTDVDLPIGYPEGLYEREEKRREKLILSLEKTPIKEINAKLKNREIKEILEWGVYNARESIAQKCVSILVLSQSKIGMSILKRALLTPSLSNKIKAYVVFLFALLGIDKKVSMVVDYSYLSFKVRKPKFEGEMKEDYNYAYALALSKVSLLTDNNLDKLAFSIVDVYKTLSSFPEENVLREEIAALSIYYSGIFKGKEYPSPCEIFNVKKERLDYLKKFCGKIRIR